jgi:hypothetical protein
MELKGALDYRAQAKAEKINGFGLSQYLQQPGFIKYYDALPRKLPQ